MGQVLVVDSSIAASWFLPDEHCDSSEQLLEDIFDEKYEMIVPDFWWSEVMHIIRSSVLRKPLADADARQIFDFLRNIPKQVKKLERGMGSMKQTIVRLSQK